MPVKGYLLIQTRMGKAKQVVEEIRRADGVTSADAVAGSWDAIATVSGDSIKDIGELVVGKLRKIDGVEKTLTCFVV
jgi:DNA-binding Lrp family transcriptional regulator